MPPTPTYTLVDSSVNVLYQAGLFTGSAIQVTGQTPSYRNGIYITNSSLPSSGIYSYSSRNAFNLNTGNSQLDTYFLSSTNYNLSTGNYTGSVYTTNISGSPDISGEWIEISFPYRLLLKSIFLLRSLYYDRANYYGLAYLPYNFVILGTNTYGSNWNIVYSQTVAPDTNVQLGLNRLTCYELSGNTIDIPNVTTAYSCFRLVTRKLTSYGGGNFLAIQQLNYFGDVYVNSTPPQSSIADSITFDSSMNISNTILSSPTTIYGLSENTNYTFTLSATNSFGTSPVATTPSILSGYN